MADHITLDNIKDHTISDTTALTSPKTIRKEFICGSKSFDLGLRTYIMGVLNITPDSFYDGGQYLDPGAALRRVAQMVEEGADVVDVGGESTRPGSQGVSLDEELGRVIPVIDAIIKEFDIAVSVDTTKSQVAKAALDAGASIVNDIGGLRFDPEIARVVAASDAGLVVMHTPSRPHDMQENTEYHSLLQDVIDALRNSVDVAKSRGVRPESIVVDPGFGFGKTTAQNLLLLKSLSSFSVLNKPVLIGTSNKSFIGDVLEMGVEERLEGTAATVALGVLGGASFVRVHDVKTMKRIVRMVEAVLAAGN